MTRFYIIGLGNPGPKYEKTRHNAGFLALDYLLSEMGFPAFRDEKYHRAQESRGQIENQNVWLVKPQTFMNLSGDTVGLLRKEGLVPEQVIVLYDDIDLPTGTIRVRDKGRAGSHNGMKSLISHLGTEKFLRIRIGIRPEHPIGNLADFVLDRFTGAELEALHQTFPMILEALRLLLTGKIAEAQLKYNQKTQSTQG
ncbi:MAG: aminoacyl-tRNA hydrolase [Candidatus Cloacimonetes bacterium]|nr:aminoacyl-tRNA hydrolase [Candidatus Cloacimonadota bacterium]